MKILITAATAFELNPILEGLNSKTIENLPGSKCTVASAQHELHFGVCGIGPMPFSYFFQKFISEHAFDLAFLVGIAGCNNEQIPLGSVVQVGAECMHPWGAEDGEKKISVWDLNLLNPNVFPFENGIIQCSERISCLPLLKGVTVTEVTGSDESVKYFNESFPNSIESMEGFYAAYISKLSHVKFVQVRAISNRIERRNRASWKIAEALQNLSLELIRILKDENSIGI